jgi:hypothetical protein
MKLTRSLCLLFVATASLVVKADTEKTVPPAELLPHMKDLPADYKQRLRKCLNAMDERIEKLRDDKEKPVVWVNSATCSFALGRHVDRLNQYFVSDAFDLKATKKNLEAYGFRLFSTTFIRFYALYNHRTGVLKGLLSPGAEKKFEEYLWNNTALCVKLADAKRDSWDSKGGENGQVTNSVGNLVAAQFLKDLPDYANRKYKDGSTAKEQYDAWLSYMSRWLDERVKHGQFQEYGASYQEYTLSALLNLRDFAEDPVLRTKAEMFLDLAFASMAEETLCTQRGGPKSRSKGHDRTCRPYKLLFDAPGGTITEPEYMNNNVLATSNYYPPRPVVDLAKDISRRGNYSFARLAPARTVAGTNETHREGEERTPWRKLDRDNPFVLNGFATSNYVLGSHGIDTTVEAENHREQRWEGIVFANDPMARIYIDGKNEELEGKYISNPLRSVQDRNVLVTMKWGPNIDKGVDPRLRITFFFSLDAVEENGGWIVVKSGGAFAAVNIVAGGYKWNKPWVHLDKFNPKEICFITLNSESSPIIFVANDATDYHNDFAAFKAAIKAQPIIYKNGVLKFATITHEGLTKPGTINDEPVQLRPSFAFESPFIRSQRGSGVVYIRKGDEAMILDFSDPKGPTKTVGAPVTSAFPPGVGSARPIIF